MPTSLKMLPYFRQIVAGVAGCAGITIKYDTVTDNPTKWNGNVICKPKI